MMRALQLDYRAGHRLRHLMGYFLLVLALALAGTIGWYFNALRLEKAGVESLIDKVQQRVHGNQTVNETSQMAPEKLAEVIKFSNKVIHQLNLPWDQLFAQLEAARGEDIALLGIEPDANGKSIKVAGEAKDYTAMVDYVRELSNQDGLQNVYLVDHKMDDQNPEKPIHFTLEATWAAK